MMDKRNKQFILRWSFVVANMLLIYMFSSQNGVESGELSGFVSAFIEKIPIVRAGGRLINIRKLAHFSIYLLLGLLTVRAVMLHSDKKSFQIVAALLICFLYACSDEFHQSLVPGRGPSFRDVMIDTAGALMGVLIVMRCNHQ